MHTRMFRVMLGVLYISVTFLFPQFFFSPRNVAIRIQQALDILHSEVCFHLSCTASPLVHHAIIAQTPHKLFVPV